MRNIWIIARREYRHYFISPIAYVFVFVMLALLGGFLFLDILYSMQSQQFVPDMQREFGLMVFPLFFLGIPAITMRTVADENRMGTLELLLTAPVSDWSLIIGKWLGTFLFFVTAIALTFVYPVLLNAIVSPGIDQGAMVTGYLGIFLIVAAMSAMGVMMSSFFKNQIAALVATYGLIILFWVISAPAQLTQGTVSEVFRYLSLTEHLYNSFLSGLINVADTVYYISMTALALFLGAIAIQTRRWQ